MTNEQARKLAEAAYAAGLGAAMTGQGTNIDAIIAAHAGQSGGLTDAPCELGELLSTLIHFIPENEPEIYRDTEAWAARAIEQRATGQPVAIVERADHQTAGVFPAMNEQRQAFERWHEDTYSYRPCWGITEYTFKEEQERWCVWQAALAQREPVAEGEVARWAITLASGGSCLRAFKHKNGEWVEHEDWQRTEAARLAVERERDALRARVAELESTIPTGKAPCVRFCEHVALNAQYHRDRQMIAALNAELSALKGQA